MRHARQVLAVALVATALCADRAASAAPVLRPQAIEKAGGIVRRLSARFSRVVQRIRLVQTRREGNSESASGQGIVGALQTTDLRPWLRLIPAQFPFPPPVS